jgi:hypothetical protein
MKALEAVIIGKRTLAGKSADERKLRRFGHGSKTVEGMNASVPLAADEPARPPRRQIIEAASRHIF